MKLIRVLLPLTSLLVTIALPSSGATIVWTNTAGGNWNVAANWNPNQVPGAADNAVVTNNGTYTVTVNAATTITGLTLGGSTGTQTLSDASFAFTLNGTSIVNNNGILALSGGTLGGSGNISISGTFNWSGGTVNRAGVTTIAVGGTLAMTGSTKTLNGATLVNAGTATWSAGSLSTGLGSVVSNAPGGTFTITFASTTGNLGGSRIVANAGQFNVAPGNGNTATFGDAFNNFATVNVQSGTLGLSGGGTNTATGTHSVSSGASLDLGGGSHNFDAGSTVSGTGNLSVSGAALLNMNGTDAITGTNILITGTFNFNPGSTASLTALTVSGGTLNCSNLVTVSGPVTWTGGSISGNNTLRANGSLTMSGTTKSLSGATLVNAGTATWSAGSLNTGQGSVLSNAPSGTFTITFASTTGNLGGSRIVANAGQFNVALGNGNTATFGDAFNNFATVNVQSGTLSLNGGGTNTVTGSYVVSSGTTLDLGSSMHNFDPGSTVSGAGNLSVSGATLNMNGTDAITGTNILNNGTFNFNPGSSASLTALAVISGTLNCSNLVTVSGPMTWTGGGISGNNTLRANGSLTMSGTTKTLNGATLVNAGTAIWSVGGLNTGQGSVLSNAPSGTFTITFGPSTGNLGGSRTVANAGQFNVAAGSGNAATFADVFNNSGTVNVQSGGLSLNGGGANTATASYVASSGATLDLGGGSHNFDPASSISGTGNFLVSGGIANLNGLFTVSGTNTFSGGIAHFLGNYTLNGNPVLVSGGTANFTTSGTITAGSLSLFSGTLGCSNLVTVSGPMTWTGGGISGNNTLRANGSLTMSGTTKTLNGATLVNAGTAIWSVGGLNTGQGSVLSNAPSGTFTITFGPSTGNLGGSRTVANAGQFNVAAGSGNAATFADVFNNSGTVNVQSGGLSLNGGGANTATASYVASSGATLDLGGGSHNFDPASSISGTGNFLVSGGIANLNGLFTVSGTNTFSGGIAHFLGNYTLNGNPVLVSGGTANFTTSGTITAGSLSLFSGTLGCSNLVTVSGPMTWTGGGISGNNTLRANGSLTMSGTTKSLSGATLVNAGTAIWSVGGLNTGQGSVLSNASSGTFTITFGPSTGNLGGSRTVANAGQFNVAAGNGNTATFADVFNNSGTVNVQSGGLTLNGTYTQTSGLTSLNGGNITNTSPLQIQGGVLAGTGTVSGSVTNNGMVSPGTSPGQLLVTGTYTQTGTGALNLELAGTVPGTGYDQLVVVGPANLAGTLQTTLTNGFYPTPGFVFTNVVRASTRNGTFAAFNYPSNVIGLQVNYGTTNAALQVINTLPILPIINNQSLDELTLLSFNVGASDNDTPAQTLTYVLTNSPAGASIDAAGLLSWNPTEAQGPTTTNITVVVTDNGTPPLTTQQTFQVTVNEVNVAPVLTMPPDLTFNELTTYSNNATATDADLPVNSLVFSLVSGPPNLSVSANGAITWTPSEAQGPGIYLVQVRVTDTNPPAVNATSLSTTGSVTLTVSEINVAPVLTLPPNLTFSELTTYSNNATATDADLPVNSLVFSLVSGPSNLTVSASGVITWTPSEAQGPSTNIVQVRVTDTNPPAVNATSLSTTGSFTLTVTESNTAPVLSMPPNLTFNELTIYSNNATATDVDLPTNSLVFSLVSGPSNLTVSASGIIVWTPSEAQGPSTNIVQVRVTDTNPPAINATSLSTTGSVTLTVSEINVAPVLTMPSNLTFNELTTYSNTATATDADLPTNTLVFSLISGPSNLNVSASGVITWTPSEAQGPSTNIVQVRVTDTNPPAVNTTSLSTTGSVTLTVSEVNVAPVLTTISNRTVNPGQIVSFTAVATDADVPTNVLSFNLIGAPAGAAVGSTSGLFSWRPSMAQANTTNFIQLRVTDTNPPAVNATSLSDTQGFTVFVNGLAPVLLTAPVYNNGQFQLQVSGSSGPDYVIMAGATPTNFTDLTTNLSASPPFQFTDPAAGSFSNRFYRVRLQP